MGFELIDRLIENATGGYTETEPEDLLSESDLEMSKEALKEWFSLMEEEMENDAHDSDEDGEEKDELEDDDEDKEAKAEALKEWFTLIEEEVAELSSNDVDSDDDDEEIEDDDDDDEEIEDDDDDDDDKNDVKSIKVEIAKEELKEWFNLIEEENEEDQMPRNNSHDEDWAEDSDNEPVPDDGEAAESAADLIGKDATKEAIKEWYKTITDGILNEDFDE